MKRILMTAGLLITLCNVTMGVAYACKCYENGVIACEGTDECWRDANDKCHCTDVIIIPIGPVKGDPVRVIGD